MQNSVSAQSDPAILTTAQAAVEHGANANFISLGFGITALIATAAVAGFFYAYSSSVMFGLNVVAPDVALKAMQGINAEVRNPVFALSFFGSAVMLIAATTIMFMQGNTASALWFSAAAITYIAGGFVLTMAINVPMNEALALIDVSSLPDPAKIWVEYENPWTFWNHVRTGFSLIAVAMAGLGLWALR
ncbi:MAG: anthrone oxygenase family protein [Pseudomonadota bacterium]